MHITQKISGSTRAVRQTWMIVVSAIALACSSGCTTSGLFSSWTHKDEVPKATSKNPAVRCLCLWEPAEGTGVDNKPARGVAGQVFFFTRDSVSSVAIEGDVRIFMFDDQGSEEEQSKPLHQFDFKDNTFQAFMTPTQFGPSYQLFVPYSRKGRHQAELAVRVRLAQEGAPPVFSDITKVVLNGHERIKPKATDEPVPGEIGGPVGSTKSDIEQFGIAEVVTPQLIEQTFRDVRLERQPPAAASPSAVTNPSKARKPQQRSVQPDISNGDLSGGEFSLNDVNVSDTSEPRHQPHRLRLRKHEEPVDDIETVQADADDTNELED